MLPSFTLPAGLRRFPLDRPAGMLRSRGDPGRHGHLPAAIDPGVSTGDVSECPVPSTDSSSSASNRRSQRSEEHTSELQSLMRLSYAVFCLKKKKTTNPTQSTTEHTT